jgi:RNA polymerase sigma-70 factor (ECF subfamily)
MGETMSDLNARIEAEIPRLRRYARTLARPPISPDDLIQECIVRALSATHVCEEGTDLRAWLFTIMHNHFINEIRRNTRQRATAPVNRDELLVCPPAQPHRLELRDLYRALGQLSEAQRAVVLLIGLEGMSYEAAAKVLGAAKGTVRSRLSRGRARLRRLMGVGYEGAQTELAA